MTLLCSLTVPVLIVKLLVATVAVPVILVSVRNHSVRKSLYEAGSWLIRTYMGDHFLFFGNAWEGVVGRVWEAVFSVIPRYFPSRDLPVFSDIGRDSGKCRQMPENVGKCCPNDGKCKIRYFFKTPSQNPPPGIIVSYT